MWPAPVPAYESGHCEPNEAQGNHRVEPLVEATKESAFVKVHAGGNGAGESGEIRPVGAL